MTERLEQLFLLIFVATFCTLAGMFSGYGIGKDEIRSQAVTRGYGVWVQKNVFKWNDEVKHAERNEVPK